MDVDKAKYAWQPDILADYYKNTTVARVPNKDRWRSMIADTVRNATWW